MIFLLFVLSIVIQLVAIWAIFFFNLNRVTGSVITIAVAILTAFILTPWALLLGIPLIALSIIILLCTRQISQNPYPIRVLPS
ncbi:hypothetical protein QQN75_11575 [Acinetobacter baumannii]|nr:hypothetical protein [Acinetobacter baumannii]MED7934474.1 hypothetical protein [Acinetobacter baumannii]MED7946524.1 hypothetical protein [Acinetobacter baumannii]MED7973487.1 hypothetical protein [Acinetobacter baumannii]MED7974863.1 hypothetical protein [Acinetobacter baumannii]MED7978372.1 hypothetical protein [Acinetobacter baumannii]